MSRYHINTGSNLGDRREWLRRAAEGLKQLFPNASITLSDIVSSQPWGYDSPNEYLNQGVMIVTSNQDSAEDILHNFRRIRALEKSLNPHSHRRDDGTYVDRAIDIDLIAVDNSVINHPVLTLPHPRMHLRPFVMGPLLQLDPGWKHPLGDNSRDAPWCIL